MAYWRIMNCSEAKPFANWGDQFLKAEALESKKTGLQNQKVPARLLA